MIHRRLGDQQSVGVATAAMLVTTAVLAGPGLASLPLRVPWAEVLVALVVLGLFCIGLALVLSTR